MISHPDPGLLEGSSILGTRFLSIASRKDACILERIIYPWEKIDLYLTQERVRSKRRPDSVVGRLEHRTSGDIFTTDERAFRTSGMVGSIFIGFQAFYDLVDDLL